MTLQEFIDKYLGKKVEYHSYGSGALYQCVDLANAYITEVLGLPAIIGTNAQDFPTKASSTNYDYILNTPLGVPEAGDLVIFKSTDNVGHISIFLEGNANLFTSFDQNYPTGSPCHKVSHNYRNVLGWLHPRQKPMADTMVIEQKVFSELVGKATKYDEFVANGYDNVNKVIENVNKLETDKNNERLAKEEAQKALVLANNAKTTSDIRVKELETQLEDVLGSLQDATSVKLELEARIIKQEGEINSLDNLLDAEIKDYDECKAELDKCLKKCNQPIPVFEEPIWQRFVDWIKKILGKLK